MKKVLNSDVVIASEEELRFTTQMLIRYASDYYKAYEALVEKYPKFGDLFPVKYFLVCRSLELAMKAYLRESGLTKQEVKSHSHDLEKLMKAVQVKGVVFSPIIQETIKFVNLTYRPKDFEYPEMGTKEVPELSPLASMVSLVINLATSKYMRRKGIMPKGEDLPDDVPIPDFP